MSEKKDRLLRLRAEKNKKRPKFKRENYFRLKRIQTSWRRPKGIDSKMRHKLKGKRKSPGSGYRGPKETRGLHPTGYEIIRVHNLKELEEVDAETQVAQLGGTVGSRKRLQMINLADDLGIHIINPRIRRVDFDEEDDFDDMDDLTLDDDEDLDLLDEDDLEDED